MRFFEEIANREGQNRNEIVLYPEGLFYKAYDRSAFACVSRISSFKPSKKRIKYCAREMASIGFPAVALAKYFPTAPRPLPDGRVVIVLKDRIDADACEVWKSSLPLKERRPRGTSKAYILTLGQGAKTGNLFVHPADLLPDGPAALAAAAPGPERPEATTGGKGGVRQQEAGERASGPEAALCGNPGLRAPGASERALGSPERRRESPESWVSGSPEPLSGSGGVSTGRSELPDAGRTGDPSGLRGTEIGAAAGGVGEPTAGVGHTGTPGPDTVRSTDYVRPTLLARLARAIRGRRKTGPERRERSGPADERPRQREANDSATETIWGPEAAAGPMREAENRPAMEAARWPEATVGETEATGGPMRETTRWREDRPADLAPATWVRKENTPERAETSRFEAPAPARRYEVPEKTERPGNRPEMLRPGTRGRSESRDERIVRLIREFRLEAATPVECLLFVADLKKEIDGYL